MIESLSAQPTKSPHESSQISKNTSKPVNLPATDAIPSHISHVPKRRIVTNDSSSQISDLTSMPHRSNYFLWPSKDSKN